METATAYGNGFLPRIETDFSDRNARGYHEKTWPLFSLDSSCNRVMFVSFCVRKR
jgi:hypothetical protein